MEEPPPANNAESVARELSALRARLTEDQKTELDREIWDRLGRRIKVNVDGESVSMRGPLGRCVGSLLDNFGRVKRHEYLTAAMSLSASGVGRLKCSLFKERSVPSLRMKSRSTPSQCVSVGVQPTCICR